MEQEVALYQPAEFVPTRCFRASSLEVGGGVFDFFVRISRGETVGGKLEKLFTIFVGSIKNRHEQASIERQRDFLVQQDLGTIEMGGYAHERHGIKIRHSHDGSISDSMPVVDA